ncbi:MAG: UDP-3-O-acyl-N-acetylglucosamine deacetylase [Synergistaceae bacterium]|nr:UDP-3-O-acyl-N-acetylglucosamine deacetylase [Synergistaceae bacterium]
MKCRRLIKDFTLEGAGLHTGRQCVIKISPNDKGGIIFKFKDFEINIEKLSLRGSGRGSDYICEDKFEIKTCEHVLSGLTGMGVWNFKLEILEGGEAPALDGCAALTSNKILENSEIIDDEKLEPLKLFAPIYIRDLNNQDRFIAAWPDENKLHITYSVSYNTPVINSQLLDFNLDLDYFYNELSRARTFAMRSEIEYLRANGMALGGSLDNAILVGDKDSKDFEASGGLRWPDEFVRHKALDLIGDLSALGRPLHAHVIACKAGHELHLKLVEKLRRLIKF